MWTMWTNLVHKGWSGLKALGTRLIWVIGIKETLTNADVMLTKTVIMHARCQYRTHFLDKVEIIVNKICF